MKIQDMSKLKFYFYISILNLFIFTNCPSNNLTEVFLPQYRSIIHDSTSDGVYTIDNNKTVDLTLNIESSHEKELYFVVTNTSQYTSDYYYNISSIRSSDKKSEFDKISDYNNDPFNHIIPGDRSTIYHNTRAAEQDEIGDKLTFQAITSFEEIEGVSATCRAVYKSPNKDQLNIWVADSVWKTGSAQYQINETDIFNLQEKFLKDNGEDIYTLGTNILGKPWGEHQFSNLIPPSDVVTILLYNELPANVMGYFYAKDNIKKSYETRSNERVMFYINSNYLKSRPDDIYSTLAHELQHAIHFYRKFVLQTQTQTETWLNELCSLAIEDLTATRMEYPNPSEMRIPSYNYLPYLGLNYWDDQGYSYGTAFSYGAYLMRNYNGPDILNRIVNSKYNGTQAITNALRDSGYNYGFGETLARWGNSVIMSDKIETLDGYSLKGTTSEYKGTEYVTEPINIFNYEYSDNLVTNLPSNSLSEFFNFGTSNHFYYAGTINGSKSYKFRLESDIKLSIILK